MGGFNPGYIPVRIIDTDIRGTAAACNGAIGGQWQRYNDWPPETGCFNTNDYAPNSNVFEETTNGAGKSPAVYYQNASISNGNIPHRVSAACRATDDPAAGPGIFQLYAPIALVYGSRALTDSATAAPTILAGPYSRSGGANGVIRVDIERAGSSNIWNIEASVLANLYYKVGVEVLSGVSDTVVNVYYDSAGKNDPSLLGGEDGLNLIFTGTFPPRAFEGPVVYAGCVAGGKLGLNTDGCAFGDLILEELEGPTGNIRPGSGGNPTPIPSPPSGAPPLPWPSFPPFQMEQVNSDFGYWRYKAVRNLTFAVNNLRLGP